MKTALTMLLLAVGSTAWAECNCYCADGELRTLCTRVSEAQGNPTLCASSAVLCHVERDAAEPVRYDSPAADAVDCRSARVSEMLAESYVDVRVCDVAQTR